MSKKTYCTPPNTMTIKEQTEQVIADSNWQYHQEFEDYYQAVINQLEEGEK